MDICVLVKSAREWNGLFVCVFALLISLLQANSERNAQVFQCTCTKLYLWDYQEKQSVNQIIKS